MNYSPSLYSTPPPFFNIQTGHKFFFFSFTSLGLLWSVECDLRERALSLWTKLRVWDSLSLYLILSLSLWTVIGLALQLRALLYNFTIICPYFVIIHWCVLCWWVCLLVYCDLWIYLIGSSCDSCLLSGGWMGPWGHVGWDIWIGEVKVGTNTL